MKTFLNKKTIMTFIIFFSVVVQGSYFIAPLIVINIFFLVSLVFKKDTYIFDKKLGVFIALFAVMVISTFSSLSLHEGISELLKYALLPLAYVFFLNMDKEEQQLTEKAFFWAFFTAMVFGLLGAIGLSPLAGMTSPATGRLQSFFQYANTAALVMGIGVFYATEKFRTSHKKEYLIIGICFAIAMFLTASRVSLVLFVPLFLLYTFRFVSTKLKLIVLGSIIIVIAVLVFFNNRIVQISIFAPTLVERYISYYDAIRLLLQNPFGIGVNNWQFMQFYHQSAPYQVQFVHNFYLQIALDGGFISLGLLLVALVYALINATKGVYFYIAIFVLSSAFFEVHFNFGSIIMYFMFVLTQLKTSEKTTGTPTFLSRVLTKVRPLKFALLLPIIPLVVLLVSNYYFNMGAANENAGNRLEAHDAYSIAHRLNPTNIDLYLRRARTTDDFNMVIYYLGRGLEVNPWDVQVLSALAKSHASLGNINLAYDYADRLLTVFPLSISNQELMRSIIIHKDEEQVETALERLDARIAYINANINPLYRHIDQYMLY